jgi:simple sugar transport system permease protein
MSILSTILETFAKPDYYFAVLRSTTPVLFATLGAIISSAAGSSNIALEGTMLVGAFVGIVVSAFTQNPWLGLLAAMFSGFLMSSVLSYFALKLKSNIIISGIALNTFASGGTVFALYLITGEKGASTSLASIKLPAMEIPFIKDIPVIGSVLSGHNVLTYVALLLVVLIWIMFNKTKLGLHIKATGEAVEAAKSAGIPVLRIKYIALCLSGILSAMGGAFLSLGYVGLFSAGMTAGRGYTALATQAIASGNAFIGLFASLLFGFCASMSNYLQGVGLPLQFIQLLPYLIIIIAYVWYCASLNNINKKVKGPKSISA